MPKHYETADMSGVLFINDRPTSANSPDLRGHVVIAGKKYWVNAWNKASRDGKRYVSLAVTDPDTYVPREPRAEKRANEAAAAPTDTAPAPLAPAGDFDDDIPF